MGLNDLKICYLEIIGFAAKKVPKYKKLRINLLQFTL
jgi:hypothetical protein